MKTALPPDRATDTAPQLRLRRTVFGREAPPAAIARSAAIYTAVSYALFELYASQPIAKLPEIPVLWQLAFIIPLYATLVTSKIYDCLRNPRKTTLLFVLGTSYDMRRSMCRGYFVKEMGELALFTGLCALFVTLLHLLLGRYHAWEPAQIIMLPCLALEFLAVRYGLPPLISSLLTAHKRDRKEGSVAVPRKTAMPLLKSRIYLAFANGATFFLPHDIRTIVKRQLLYLLRYDAVTAAIINLAALPFCILLLMMLKDGYAAAVSATTCLFIPSCILLYQAELFTLSTAKLHECPYYPYTAPTIITAYTVFCAMMTLPFPLLYSIYKLMIFGAKSATIIDIITFVCSWAAMNRIAAVFYYCKPFSNAYAAAVLALLFPAIVGLWIPLWGWFLPIVSLVTVRILEPRDLASLRSWRG